MRDGAGEGRNVFSQQMICVLDAPIQVGDFVVGLVGEVLFVSVVDEARSENIKSTM